jgi:hypothetical protein
MSFFWDRVVLTPRLRGERRFGLMVVLMWHLNPGLFKRVAG